MASNYFRPYPGGPLLERERRVGNRAMKERARGGTKFLKVAVEYGTPYDLKPFLNRILCSDAETVLGRFPPDSIDLVVTSPPYNFGQAYPDVQDALRWDAYFGKLQRIWAECARVLKPGGRICVNVQPLFSDYVPTHNIIPRQLADLGRGSWKSPSMPYLKYQWLRMSDAL